MKRSDNFLSIFIFFIVFCFITYFLSKTALFKLPSSILASLFSPIQSVARSATIGIFNITLDSSKEQLKAENMELVKKLAELEEIKAQNNSLMDQFQTSNPKSQDLIAAAVVGAPGFIPGVSSPEFLIIDKGEGDDLRIGDTVVFKDSLVGTVSKISSRLSKVRLISNLESSFTVRVGDKGILGVVKGLAEGNILVDNILLSESVKKGDLVTTGSNVQEEGSGFPPGLIVGKIASVEKVPSALFQKAEVKPLVDFSKLSTVFIFKN